MWQGKRLGEKAKKRWRGKEFQNSSEKFTGMVEKAEETEIGPLKLKVPLVKQRGYLGSDVIKGRNFIQ